MDFRPPIAAVLFAILLVGCASGTVGSRDDPGTAMQGLAIDRRSADDAPVSARRELEARLDTLPIGGVQRSHPKIGRNRGRGTLSIGTTRDGFVVGCRRLPVDNPGLKMLAVQSRRGTDCGTDDLVGALVSAAAVVAKAHRGGTMTVGNIGREGGGDIPWSISHNSGRDADLGFFLLGPDGRPFVPTNLVRLDGQGRGFIDGVHVRLDVRRTWRMVRALLENPSVSIQWMFVSTKLKNILLDHARKQKEPAQTVRKADEVLNQPHRARPHDDHIHLRIYCPSDDVLEGCRDKGSNRSWFQGHDDLIAARAADLRALCRAKAPATRADAVTVLGRLGRTEDLGTAIRLLGDSTPEVRVAAAEAVRGIGAGPAAVDVSRRAESARDDAVTRILLEALEAIPSAESRATALGRLLPCGRTFVVDTGVFRYPWTVRDWALAALGRIGDSEAVAELVAALDRPGVDSDAVAGMLGRLTAADPAPDRPGAEAVAAWRDWWSQHRKERPSEWYRAALREYGVADDGLPEGSGAADVLERMASTDRHRLAATRLVKALTRGRVSRLPVDGIEPLPALLRRAFGVADAREDDPTGHDTDGPD